MSWDALLEPDPQAEKDPTSADVLVKPAVSTVASIGSDLAGLARLGADYSNSPNAAQFFKEVQGITRRASDDVTGSMTEEGQHRLGLALTDPEFWNHPIQNGAMKLSGMVPYMVAATIPGTLVAGAAQKIAAVAAAGGVLGAGDVVEEVMGGIDKASDEDLKAQSTLYRGLRADMSQADAREEFNKQILGIKPAIAFAIGVGSGLYGPAGNIGRMLTREGATRAAKRGLLKSAGLEGQHGVRAAAAEGLATETLEEGYGAQAAQQAEIERGAREKYDVGEIAARAITGGGLGALVGGASGIGGGKKKGRTSETAEGIGEEDTAVQTPAATAQVGAEVGATTAAAKIKAGKKGVEVVEPIGPNMAEATAIADTQQPAQPQVAPVAEPAPPQQAAPTNVPPPPAASEVVPTQQSVAPTAQVAAPTTQQALGVPPQVPAAVPTDISARARAPVTSEVTSGLQQTTAPPEVSAVAPPVDQTVASVEPSGAEPVTREVAPVAPTQPRVLQDISPEAQLRAKEQVAAQRAAEREAAKPGAAEREPGSKKLSPAERASQASRTEKAQQLFDKHHTPLTMPEAPEARRLMALHIQNVLEDAKAQGLELREDLPEKIRNHFSPPKGYKSPGITEAERHRYHESIPTKVGGKEMSPHVRYLRELVGIQKALLGQKFGPKSKERLRVQQFIAEHNAKDLESLSARRKEEGDEVKRVYQGDVETATAGPKAKITTETTGAASEGRVLTGEAKAKALAEYEARQAKPALELPPKAQAVVEKAKAKEGVTEKEWTTLTTALADESKDHPDVKRIKDIVQKQLVAEAKPEPTLPPKAAAVVEKAKAREAGKSGKQTAPATEIKPEAMKTESETKPEQEEKVTPEVTEPPKGPSQGTVEKTKYDRLREAQADKAQAAELEARMKASQERAAKAKPRATPEQIKAAIAAMKAKKEAGPKIYPITRDTRTDEDAGVVLHRDEYDIWDTPLHKARDTFGHPSNSISMEGTAKEFLDNLNLDHLAELPKYLQDFTRRRLAEIVGHVKVYVADANLIVDATGRKSPGGYYHPGAAAHGKDYIVVNAATVGKAKGFAHVVIHEALHAAMYNRLRTNAEFRGRIERLMAHLDQHTKGTEHAKTARYALTNSDEFVSEALSNPKLQALMANMTLTTEQVRALGLPFAPRAMSLWNAFVGKVRQMLNLPPGTHNFLHEAFNVIGPELGQVRAQQVRTGTKPGQRQALDMDALQAAATGRLEDTGTNLRGNLARAKDHLSTAWNMARRGAAYFGPDNPLNRLFDQRAKQEAEKDKILERYGGAKAIAAIARAEREHPEAMARAKDVLFDASMHDVNLDGSNDHLGKDKLMGIQAKNEVARLKAAWANPAINAVRKTLQDAMTFFRDIHNAVSHETVKNILAEANIHDASLAERIHKNGLSEDDKTWADNKLVSALNEVQALKYRQGSYVPFRRYGEFISAAEHELSVPANATKINDNTLQFVDPKPKNGEYGNARARAAVKGYLRQKAHTPQGNKLVPSQIRKVWVDKNNPANILEAEDLDAIPAYRVAMQTQHTEFHEAEADAVRNRQTLADAGLVNARTHKREEAYKNERNIQGAMGTILRSLEKQQRYIDADPIQKAAMREMFTDLTRGLSGTTSIKNSMKHRRNVAGMSHDLGRVTADYARMTANHLSKLRFRPEIDRIFAGMRQYIKGHEGDKDNIRREEVYNEFINRIYGSAATQAEAHKPGVVTRLLQMSRLSRLAGPSFHIINAHEPWTTSLPIIGGRHGFTQTARQLVDVYNLIGGRAGVISGFRDMASAYTNDTGFTDYTKLFKEAIGKSKTLGSDKGARLQSVIDYMADRNLYANSAIFEVGRYASADSNLAGRALDRADLMANQVGSAIEAINRTVTGLSAYNLEYRKNGGNHEAAMHYAYSTAHDTMGDYSNWNAAPAFNTPLGRIALQFKKFGHKTYYLLGNIMGGVLRGDPQAMKQFAGVMVTHGLVAGALGLPTEPFKIALMAANMVGITGFTPDDYEYAVRQLAARVAGQKGGEIISKGLYRGIGIDVSSRLGLDTLLTHGQPKSTKANDIKSWLFDTLAGAPAGYLLDQVAAAQAIAKGDIATAIEKASPIRAVGDIAKAVSGAMGDKKSPSGTTTQEQFTAWETGVRALGFTPSSASEMGALRGTVARESRRTGGERTELMNTWADATGGDKVRAQREVQTWNARHPEEEQISQRDLENAARRREREKTTTKHGVNVNRRTKAIYTRAESVFNP